MIPDQKINVTWNKRTKNYYIEKGYSFTKFGDNFEVNIKDLTKGSWVEVYFICDYCNGHNQRDIQSKRKMYKELTKARKNISKDCCNHIDCKNLKLQESYMNKLIAKKNTFGDNFPELIKEWSPRNDKTPFEYPLASSKKVWWICEKGHEYLETINKRTMSRRGCPYCSGRRVCEDNCLAKVYPEIAQEWNYSKNKDLTPSDVTYGSEKKVWWTCKTCNSDFYANIYNRTGNDSGCPICKESKGEKQIRKWLTYYGINFNPQKVFKGLIGIGGGNLSYDFYLPNQNILIEYQGNFHDGSGTNYTKVNLEYQQEHDKRKREFAERNNIKLLEIWHWDFENIEKILQKELEF